MTKRTSPTDPPANRPEIAGAVHAPARDGRGRFSKGKSGNPRGKPQGRRNLATEAVQALLEGEADALTRRAVQIALTGEGREAVLALKLCLERLAPAPRDRAIQVELPAVCDATTVTDALSAILDAVAKGIVTPTEGNTLSGLVELIGRAWEREALEDRIAALESRREGANQ